VGLSVATVPPRPSATSCEQFKVNAAMDSLFQSQVALMRMELLQLVDVRGKRLALFVKIWLL
jgi:hypothetical protein